MNPPVDEIVLSPRVFFPKSRVWSGLVRLKSQEGITSKTVGEHCHRVCGVSKLHPHFERSLIPEILFIQENSALKCLKSRFVLNETICTERAHVQLIKLQPDLVSALTNVRAKFFNVRTCNIELDSGVVRFKVFEFCFSSVL